MELTLNDLYIIMSLLYLAYRIGYKNGIKHTKNNRHKAH